MSGLVVFCLTMSGLVFGCLVISGLVVCCLAMSGLVFGCRFNTEIFTSKQINAEQCSMIVHINMSVNITVCQDDANLISKRITDHCLDAVADNNQ